MKRRFFGWRNGLSAAWMVSVAMLALALPLAARAEPGKARPRTATSPADGLPKVSLTDQNGRAIALSSLKGKPALVAFIHTSCEGPCEMITAEMKSVARSLGPGFKSEVTMVSITTDPKEDGSRELLAYAKAQGVDADGWVFLTGAPTEIRRLLVLYGVSAEDDDSDHVLELFLLSADGVGVHRYNGVATRPETIATDIRKTASLH
ncbi:MAG TPA: SCO family protein [Candidatus Binataceae bacterium]|nr:SCO family protein [Candidatus Binataceae bacterium]